MGTAPDPAAQIEDCHPAGAKDERGELFGVTEPAGPEGLNRVDKDILHEILGGAFIAQVAESVEADARGHPSNQFGLGFRAALLADPVRQLSVAQVVCHPYVFYV
jgi:hypothetical protein